jgi:hypothetical protein
MVSISTLALFPGDEQGRRSLSGSGRSAEAPVID